MTQPQQSTLSRKFIWEVNTGTEAVPVWTMVKGLAEFKPTPGEPNLEDDNVYEDAGYTGQTKTALSWSLEAKVMRRTLPSDATVYDPGQEALRLKALVLGTGGVMQTRWYDRDGGPEAYSGWAEVSWSPEGGSPTDLESVSITLTGKGAVTAITNPNAAALVVPVVTSVTPATGSTAGGTLVKITGVFKSLVAGATAVKFGSTNATSYIVQDTQTIYAVSPANTAGIKDVIVTNTAGASSGAGTANDFLYV